jgi:cytochrome b involved in lipid metabolism
MNNKITIVLLPLIIIVVIISLSLNKKNQDITPIEEISPRNDIVANEEATTTQQVVKSYSLAEVALHDKADDCWLVIEGKVINPTQFIAEGKHPNDFILKGCGKDATSMFKNIPKHEGPTPQEALKQYQIGVLR